MSKKIGIIMALIVCLVSGCSVVTELEPKIEFVVKTPEETETEYPSLSRMPRNDSGYLLEDYIKNACASPELGTVSGTLMEMDDILGIITWKNIGKGRFSLLVENVHNESYAEIKEYATQDRTWTIMLYYNEKDVGQSGFPKVTIEGKGSLVRCYPTYYQPCFLIPADVLEKLLDILDILKDAPNDGHCPLDGKMSYTMQK